MSPDIDELLRTTMRRHAADAPTRIDLDAVRTRSSAITRRRRFEAVAAVVTTLVVLLGLGYAASQLRTQATPVEPSPTGGAWTAFFRFDQNAGQSGQAKLLVRTGGGETEVTSADRAAKVVGWYGADHRTLVYAEGNYTTSAQSPLKAVTFGADGSVAAAPAPLSVPGAGALSGIAFPLDDGFAVWRTTGSDPRQGELVRVDDTLDQAVVQPLPSGGPVFVTSAVVALLDDQTNRTSILSTDGQVEHTVTLCSGPVAQAVAPDGIHTAIGCTDGQVDLLNLSTGKVFRTSAVPGATEPGEILGVWYDPALSLHLSMTPEGQANFTDVRDFAWDSVSWTQEGTGVLTRVFPSGSSPIRLEHLAKDGVDSFNVGRWILQATDADLGASTGTIAVRAVEKATPTPTPSPSSTTQALPPAPATPPWTATVHDVPGAAPPRAEVDVTIDGRTRQIDPGTNAATEIAGWTGPDRRTLVWGYTQDYVGDQEIVTATFAADGTLSAGPTRLKAPDGTPLAGRPVVLPDGRLVVWRYGASAARHVQGTLLRYSADLSTATTQRLPEGDLVFATPGYVGLQEAQFAPSALTIVPADGSAATTITPSLGSCATGYRASISTTGDFAALSCDSDQVDIVPVAQAGSAGTQPLGALPDGAKVLATWFTPGDDLFASTRADDGTVSTWRYEPGTGSTGTWPKAATQGVAFASYVDGYAVQLVAERSTDFLVRGTWSTGTDPSLTLGTGDGFASLVARPAG